MQQHCRQMDHSYATSSTWIHYRHKTHDSQFQRKPYQLFTRPQYQLNGIQEDHHHHKCLISCRLQKLRDKFFCYELFSMTLIHVHNVIKILLNFSIFLFLLLFSHQNGIDLRTERQGSADKPRATCCSKASVQLASKVADFQLPHLHLAPPLW